MDQELFNPQSSSVSSSRVLYTPSSFARTSLLHLQEGRTRAITSGKLKVTPERIAEAPDMLHLEKGIYCAFIKSGVLQGDVAIYKTNFGVTLTTKGNRRTLNSFMGYKRCDLNGTAVYVDAPYKVYGFSIQYRRYLMTVAKRERGIAV